MALIGKNKDGSYASSCALCEQPLSNPIFATSHFIADQTHDLYRFSDAAMHWDCYSRWPHQSRFASMFFEANVKRLEIDPWPKYWPVVWKSKDVLVQYGLAVSEVSILPKKTGATIRIQRADWSSWIEGEWQNSCKHPLEFQALADLIPDIKKLSLPYQQGPENNNSSAIS